MPLQYHSILAALAVAGGLLLETQPPSLAQGPDVSSSGRNAPSRRVYSHLLDPREHPDYGRRAVKPPTWETFKNRTQFTALRGFNVQDDNIVGYTGEIEKFTRTHELGDVIWPSYPILFAKNLGDLADEIKRRDLYLFDIWGYVPGSGPGGYWQQFEPPVEAFATLESKLGERWLGTDIGEQDGRYIGGYASQMTPASASRFEQYLNFQRHFERMGGDLGHKHATLVSLNFGHYFLKEGTYTLIGAETAQALPNNQVYYAFIRGAGKQYGVPWFGNASIFNRWGFKTYGSSGHSDGYEFGPTKGTSLSLMKRLLYSHILYNCVAVGFENGWLEGDKLSPIGQIQQAAQRWVREHGQPGVMHSPVAVLLDFHSGWTFPRHLYSDKIYRVWGNLPYGPGDYLTDAILDLLYPGYQDSSYFHDERGFIAPTPYGDIADCLLSDAPGWLLARYPVVVVGGELSGGHEIRDKLLTYVEGGGHLVITAGNLAKLPGGIAARTTAAATVVTNCGRGRMTALASDFGLEAKAHPGVPWRSEIDKPLPKPYELRADVRQALDEIFRGQQLFEAGSRELSLITCRKGPGEYTLGIANNSWRALPLNIVSHCGLIESIRELTLARSEQGAAGCVPEGVDGSQLGLSAAETIAGGDIRIFAVKVQEIGVEEIPHVAPPPRPRGRVLPLRHARSIKEEILARPAFFEHFDGLVVDWRYLHEREKAALQQEAGWIHRQGLRVSVDLSSGLNLYPTLRLTDNLAADYAASLAAVADVLSKMEIIGARDLILSLHRHPENNFSGEQTEAAFEKTLRTLASQAAERQVTLNMRMAFGKPPWSLDEANRLLDKIGAKNLRLAASTALLATAGPSDDVAKMLKDKLGLWLVAAPRFDLPGKLWDAHAPVLRASDTASIAQWLALAPDAPMILDAVYANQDEEYLDAVALERLSRKTSHEP
ncbi:MAG: hypothetical protein HY674_22675 [Chloroflexi bacterium]|nr:hypothetical protein [Chloroflexota bacterium]